MFNQFVMKLPEEREEEFFLWCNLESGRPRSTARGPASWCHRPRIEDILPSFSRFSWWEQRPMIKIQWCYVATFLLFFIMGATNDQMKNRTFRSGVPNLFSTAYHPMINKWFCVPPKAKTICLPSTIFYCSSSFENNCF